MPVDLNGKSVSSPRLSARERDLESRRSKGEASCAECRRLKLKCDRKNPCTSCVRRGCQTICPNGSLAAGQGTRFVLANTDKLHQKLLEMSQRIRQLEDALKITQASVTPASHPLLSEELLSIKTSADIMLPAEQANYNDGSDDGDLRSELGTLSISKQGEACFVGRASNEALLMFIDDSLSDHLDYEKNLGDSFRDVATTPQQILSISRAFPFTPSHLPREETLRQIEGFLPPYARATALAEAYLGNIAWFATIVERDQIFEELLPSVYKHADVYGYHTNASSTEDDVDSGRDSDYVHCLALLLGVLASGAAGDLTLSLGNDEAELYLHLSRAALSLNSVFTGASMESVQAILMIAIYDFCSSRKWSVEPTWKTMSFGLGLMASIGLHRDPARWKMEPKIVQRRRRLFWEVFGYDKWKSLESGRPATFNLREIDCEFPTDTEATLGEDGSIIPGFRHWKYRFLKEVIAPAAEQLCLARQLKYPEILELDRKFRGFESHPSMAIKISLGYDEDMTSAMRRFNWGMLREMCLLFVHRVNFARGMLETPTKPLSSPFVSSVLSSYASAITLLKIMRVYFEKYPQLILRQWIVWSQSLSSAVIIGAVAFRGQASHTAAAALKELEATVDLFQKAQQHPIPRRGLPYLRRLLEKARIANESAFPRNLGNAEKELNILSGVPLLLNNAKQRSSTSNKGSTQGDRPALPKQPLGNRSWTLPQQHHSSTANTDAHRSFALQSNMSGNPDEPIHQTHSDNLAPHNRLLPTPFQSSSSSFEIPFTDQLHPTASELSSTSWLEVLSNTMSECYAQDIVKDNGGASFDTFIDGAAIPNSNTFPRPEQGDDPVVTNAWLSLMTDSQLFGSGFTTSGL